MKDRITIRKWYWAWEFDKEEAWLGEMAMSGWVLDSVGYATYHFVRCEPGEYTVRLELHPADESYVAFMEETGAEYLGRMVMWMFFRKKTADGPFDLFSDTDSRLAHLSKVGRLLLTFGCLNLFIGILNNALHGSFVSSMNLLVATLLMYGLGRIHGMKDALEKERLLHE